MPGGAGTPGGYDGGGGGFGGGGGGGEGGAAQRAAAQRAQAQLNADRLNAQRAAAAVAKENEARETARENAIQLAALTPKTIEPVRSPHRDTPLQVLEQEILDKDRDREFQDTKAKAPTTLIPKTVTYDKGNPFTDRLIPTTVGQTLFDPRTSQNALLKRPGGIGTTLKNVAKNVALGVLAPQLLAGTKLAPFYQGYRTYQFLPKKVQETIRTAFKPNLKSRLTTETKRKTTPFVDRDRNKQRVKTVAEKVTTGQGLESGAKLLGVPNTQKAELFKRRNIVQDILRKGSYQGRDLTSGQKII